MIGGFFFVGYQFLRKLTVPMCCITAMLPQSSTFHLATGSQKQSVWAGGGGGGG